MGLETWTRREFLASALATGGIGGLGACLEVEGTRRSIPNGDPESTPERQFGWNDYLPTDSAGNVRTPDHQLLLFLDLVRDGPPTPTDRRRVNRAFRTLERAYRWGTGGESDAESIRGLLFLVGYSPGYFDRFEADLPPGSSPTRAEEIIDELGEDAEPDAADAVLAMSSDVVSVLLSAEQALRGNFDTLNGEPVAGDLAETFDVVDRRTGFSGAGRPARAFDADVPEASPSAMGYRIGFQESQRRESRVEISLGPFAGGSTLQVSRLALDLDAWYDVGESGRVHRMFSPAHTVDDVGSTGERLDSGNQLTRETVDSTVADAKDLGVVGHAQKAATARNEAFEPRILRRTVAASTDLDVPGTNFLSLQRFLSDFLDVRRAMNCPAHVGDFGRRDEDDGEEQSDAEPTECPEHARVPAEQNGIAGFTDVLNRGTYLVPPRRHRALPAPQPDPGG